MTRLLVTFGIALALIVSYLGMVQANDQGKAQQASSTPEKKQIINHDKETTVTVSNGQVVLIKKAEVVEVDGKIVMSMSGNYVNAQDAGCNCSEIKIESKPLAKEVVQGMTSTTIFTVKDDGQAANLKDIADFLIRNFPNTVPKVVATDKVPTTQQQAELKKMQQRKDECQIKDFSFDKDTGKIKVENYAESEFSSQLSCLSDYMKTVYFMEEDQRTKEVKDRVTKVIAAVKSKYMTYQQKPKDKRDPELEEAFKEFFTTNIERFDGIGSDEGIRTGLQRAQAEVARNGAEMARNNLSTTFNLIRRDYRDAFEMNIASGNIEGAMAIRQAYQAQLEEFTKQVRETQAEAWAFANDPTYSKALGGMGSFNSELLTFARDPGPMASLHSMLRRFDQEILMARQNPQRSGSFDMGGRTGTYSSFDLNDDLRGQNSMNGRGGGWNQNGQQQGQVYSNGRGGMNMPTTMQQFHRGNAVSRGQWNEALPMTPQLGNTAVGTYTPGQATRMAGDNQNIWNGMAGTGQYAFPPPANFAQNGNFQGNSQFRTQQPLVGNRSGGRSIVPR